MSTIDAAPVSGTAHSVSSIEGSGSPAPVVCPTRRADRNTGTASGVLATPTHTLMTPTSFAGWPELRTGGRDAAPMRWPGGH